MALIKYLINKAKIFIIIFAFITIAGDSQKELQGAISISPTILLNGVYSDKYLYIASFEPNESGRWFGNIKKYLINEQDGISNYLQDDVRSNGAGEALMRQSWRNIYTYTGKTAFLNHQDNFFNYTNNLLTNLMLGVTTDEERKNLINDVCGINRSWKLGDIIHSEPSIVRYSNKTVIFAGANDGMFHCFDDNGLTELWGFIPAPQLKRLSLLNDSKHDYFLDASPVLFENGSQKIILFGEGRGGKYYYALDVSNYNSPILLYEIATDYLGQRGEKLGESWSKAEICKIKTSENTTEDVFLIAGGYDENNTAGRAVFTVKASNGSLSSLNFNPNNFPQMAHPIVAASGFDHDGDGIVSRVYAGDLGGNLFAIRDDNNDNYGDTDGSWEGIKLFSAPIEIGQGYKKIFYGPEAAEERFGEYIFLGTGDMVNLYETDVVNRFYAIKNDWTQTSTITESDLVDVTEEIADESGQKNLIQELENKKGWYIKLTEKGEKAAGSPILFGGWIYFTTYTPDLSSANELSGTARLYKIYYKTGSASILGFGLNEKEANKAKSKIIGSGIPSSPVISILKNNPVIYINTGQNVIVEQPPALPPLTTYYWRQLE